MKMRAFLFLLWCAAGPAAASPFSARPPSPGPLSSVAEKYSPFIRQREPRSAESAGRQMPPSGRESEDLRQILHAPDSETLKKVMDRQKERDFLRKLCEEQKRFSNIPSACYKLKPFDSASDPFCLRLRLKDLEPEILKGALKLSVLSLACRKHLELQLKILNYRNLRKRGGAPPPFSFETEKSSFL